jgi:hypothetical protein
MTCDASSLSSAMVLVTMALIMLIGDDSTTFYTVWHLAHPPPPGHSCRYLGHSCRAKAVDCAVATLPLILAIPTIPAVAVVPQIHVVSNIAALPLMSAVVPAVMPKLTMPPMPAVVPTVGTLPLILVVVPKVGDLSPMPSVWPVFNRRCPPSRQRQSP